MAHLELSPAEVVAVRRVLAVDAADHPDFPTRSRDLLAALQRLIPCDRLGLWLLDEDDYAELRVELPARHRARHPLDRLWVVSPLPGRHTARLHLDRDHQRFEPRHVELLHMLHPAIARQLGPPERVEAVRPSSALSQLSVAELQVLRLVAFGATNLDVARRLSVSEATVRKHLEHVYRKLGVRNRTAAAALVRAPAQP